MFLGSYDEGVEEKLLRDDAPLAKIGVEKTTQRVVLSTLGWKKWSVKLEVKLSPLRRTHLSAIFLLYNLIIWPKEHEKCFG